MIFNLLFKKNIYIFGEKFKKFGPGFRQVQVSIQVSNFGPWAGPGFRHNHEWCLMAIIFLHPQNGFYSQNVIVYFNSITNLYITILNRFEFKLIDFLIKLILNLT